MDTDAPREPCVRFVACNQSSVQVFPLHALPLRFPALPPALKDFVQNRTQSVTRMPSIFELLEHRRQECERFPPSTLRRRAHRVLARSVVLVLLAVHSSLSRRPPVSSSETRIPES